MTRTEVESCTNWGDLRVIDYLFYDPDVEHRSDRSRRVVMFVEEDTYYPEDYIRIVDLEGRDGWLSIEAIKGIY